jgi:hypothetical protein
MIDDTQRVGSQPPSVFETTPPDGDRVLINGGVLDSTRCVWCLWRIGQCERPQGLRVLGRRSTKRNAANDAFYGDVRLAA